MTKIDDLIVIGGGPAGLSAAINGASEGLSVRLIDNGSSLGGQARESSAIENYPGFPDGITGTDFTSRLATQAHKFETGFVCPVSVVAIERYEDSNTFVVTTEDYQEYMSKTVLLSIGLNYRRLSVDGAGRFLGRGIYYGAPDFLPKLKRSETVGVIGGANSAGQAVLNLARDPLRTVHMFVRRRLTDAMSTYLVDRIRKSGNIRVHENSEVTGVDGSDRLERVHSNAFRGDFVPMTALYVYIGAMPRTLWLKDQFQLDDKKFIRTWPDLDEGSDPRCALPFCTCIPGVFAAGDVRSGSTKRIASGVGEGAAALQMIHRYLAKGE